MTRTEFDIHSLARLVAPHIPGYSFAVPGDQENRSHGYLKSGEGRGITLSYSQGRITVAGLWPKDRYPSRLYVDGQPQASPNITVAADREPVAIAKEILRRFLPAYERLYVLATEAAAEDTAFTNGTQALIERLTVLAGEQRNTYRPENITFYRKFPGCSYGIARVNGPDSVDMELSLNGEAAAAVLAFLGGRK